LRPPRNLITALLFSLAVFLPLMYGGRSLEGLLLLRLIVTGIAGYYFSTVKNWRSFPGYLIPTALLFFAWAGISSLFSSAPYLSLDYFFMLFPGCLFFILTFQTCSDQLNQKTALGLTLAGVLLCAGIGISMFVITHPFYGTPMHSTFYQSNAFAAYLLLFIPLFLSGMLLSEDPVIRSISAICFYILGLCLWMSYSRAGWISFGIVCLIFLIINLKALLLNYRRFLILFIVVAGIFITGSALTRQETPIEAPAVNKIHTDLLISNNDSSVAARISFWKSAIRMAQTHPFLGIGFELFSRYYPMYQSDPRYFGKYAHSSLLEFWCETGYPGVMFLLAFIAICFVFLYHGWILQKNRTNGFVYSGLLLGLIGALIHSFVDMDFKYPAFIISFLAILSLLLSSIEPNSVHPITSPFKIRLFRISGLLLLLLLPIFFLDYFSQKNLEKAIFFRERGNRVLAYQHLVLAGKLNPFTPEIYYQKADMDFLKFLYKHNQADLESAFRNTEHLIKLDSHKAFAYYFAAQILHSGPAYVQALEKAIQLDPLGFPMFYNDLSFYYYQNNQLNKALTTLETLMNLYKNVPLNEFLFFRQDSLKPQFSASFTILGDIWVKKCNLVKAKKAYSQAISYDPKNPDPYLALGILAFQAGKYPQAIVFFDKCIKLEPDYSPGWLLLGAACKKAGFSKKGNDYETKALRISPHLNKKNILRRLLQENGR